MAFIHCNAVVQQIAAATLDPSLRDTVLPRAFERGPHRPDLQGSHRCRNLDSIFAIPVEDQEPGSRFKWKRFPQLLNDPEAGRVLGDVQVQNPPTFMADHKKAVEHTERDGRDREEVHRGNRLAMITKKSKP